MAIRPSPLRRRAITAGALAAATLGLAQASSAALTTWEYGGAILGYYVNAKEGPAMALYDSEAVPLFISGTPIEEGIQIQGTGDNGLAFTLSTSQYQPGLQGDPDYRGNFLCVYGSGAIDGASWQHPEDAIRSNFEILLSLNFGELDVFSVESSYMLFDAGNNITASVGSSGYNNTFEPGGYGVGFAYEDRFGSGYETAVSFNWAIIIRFEWLFPRGDSSIAMGFSENGTTLYTVPAPASAAGLMLAGLAGMRRRR